MTTAAPGVLVSFKTVSIADCNSEKDFGLLITSAPNVLHKAVTDSSNAIAIRFIEINLANAAIMRCIKGFTPAAWVKANAKEKVIAQAA